jgi:hypothetical protein
MIQCKVAKAACKVCSKPIFHAPDLAEKAGQIYFKGSLKSVDPKDPLCLGCKQRYN